MAIPSLPPSDPAAASFADLLELDLPPVQLAPWAKTAIAAIVAVMPVPPDAAVEALATLIEPLRAMPEGTDKDAVRAALAAKKAEIAKARAAATPPPPATVEQPIPVIRDVTPVVAPVVAPVEPTTELRSPFVHSGRWIPLMRAARDATTGRLASYGSNGYRQPSGAERARRVEPDAWGARIEHAPGDGPTVGSLVRVTNTRNTRSAVHVVEQVITTDELTTIAAVSSRPATAEQQAPRLVAVGSAPITAPVAAPAARPAGIPEGAIPLSDLMPERSAPAAVETALASVASEGTAIATAERSPEIVQPTERGTGTTNADSGASVGIFARPRSERVFRVGTPPLDGTRATTTERARLLTERALIAGSVAANGWLQVSWTGEGSTLHGAVNDALIAVGREGSDMPPVPTGENYAGEAVGEMRGREYDTKRLPNNGLPEGIEARWIVGRALGGEQAARAGDPYGVTLLRVDLREDGTLVFDGDLAIANSIRTRYATKVARVTLNSKHLTPWLARILRTRHGAVKRGHCWYVPPGQAKAVRALIGGPNYAQAVEEWAANGGEGPLPKFDEGSIGRLWGDHELMSVNTGADLLSSLSNGLRNEVQRIAASFTDKTKAAREAARKQATKKASAIHGATEAYIAAEGQAAFDRATISSVVAASLLRDLGTVAARLAGYSTVLGDGATAGVAELISSLRGTLEPLTDDTSIRGAMLELE